MKNATTTPGILTALAGSFDWSGNSGRLTFAVALLITTIFIGLGMELGWHDTAPLLFFGVAALLLFAFLGQMRRRMRDAGWHGAWMWVCVIPYVGLIPQLVLLFRKGQGRQVGESAILRRAGWMLALAVCVIFATRGFWWAPYWVPSGNMKPGLQVNDFIVVRQSSTVPARGDVIVFRHPVQGTDFVKRVIGLPGDTVALEAGQVLLNGVPLPQDDAGLFVETFERQGAMGLLPRCANGAVGIGQRCEKRALVETLPSGRSYTVLDIAQTPLDTTRMFTVPEGHLFVLGDNRDNSADSRIAQAARGMGFVPVENVMGRVTLVLFSFSGDLDRVMKGVR